MKNKSQKKINSTMKYFVSFRLLALLFSFIFSSFAFSAVAQDAKISLSIKDKPLKEVLNAIEAKSGYSYLVRSNDVNLNEIVSIDAENKSVREVLVQLFKPSQIDFEIKGKSISIFKSQTKQNEVSATQKVRKITGVVTDQKGEPIIGASVFVKQTSIATITDVEGNFSLNVPVQSTLSVTYIGYTPLDVKVGKQERLVVKLEEDTKTLSEVVVVGYGTQNKQAVTGAATVAKLDVYKVVPENNILESLKGTIAGLSISGANAAGAVPSIMIRGQNSIGASTAPLLVVDGAIYNGSLGDINNEDIENFTVLKDASAAAIYGARSSNGVILIETKKGRGLNGKPKFEVKTTYGISNELAPLELYNAEGYIQRLLDIRTSRGIDADPTKIAMYLQTEEQKNYNATPDHIPTVTDPFGAMRQTAYNKKVNFSVSNKTENNSYYVAFSVTDQKGVVINDKYKNATARINISSDLTKWFNLGIKSFYSIRDYSGSEPPLDLATGYSPYASVYNEDGTYKDYPQTTTSFLNPFWYINTSDVDLQNHLSGILTANIKVPWIKGLSYTMNFSNDLRWNERFLFRDKSTYLGRRENASGSRSYSKGFNLLFDNIVKYRNTFADKHMVDITLVHSRESYKSESITANASQFDNAVLLDYKLENGKVQTVDTGGGESGSIGQMGRATYSFDDRYTITGTVRRDGFSAFSKNKKWGLFSSLGANWNIGKESFMKNQSLIDNLALRASYGRNGNQSISSYSTLAKVGTGAYLYPGDINYSLTEKISSFALDNLGWEKTTGLNLGLDFGILKNRITGSIDAYKTKTEDLLFSLSMPYISGKSSIMSNIGQIDNKGLEVALHTVNVKKADFEWNSDFAFSINRNKVATIYGEDKNGDGKEDDLINSNIFIGKTLGTIYYYKILGMYQQSDVDNGTIMTGARPGEYIIEDLPDANGNIDGKISSTNDRQFLGDSNPNFRWSWTNTFSYKNFSLMAYIYSIWGGNGHYLGANTPYLDAYSGVESFNHPVYDYWMPNNTGAEFPRPDYAGFAKYKVTRYYDRSFIKLQKVALSYNFTSLVKPHGINDLTLTFSADNLLTFAPHWQGLDPETGQGLNWTSRPSMRTYLLSLSINF
jgi:TonB-dependent starch-binding outer membrane protein SusC